MKFGKFVCKNEKRLVNEYIGVKVDKKLSHFMLIASTQLHVC